MKTTLGSLSLFFLASVLAFAGGSVTGDYVEARNADIYTGPCFANSEVGLVGVLVVFGLKTSQGSWQGVNLDGLSVMGIVRASSTLGDVYHSSYPIKSALIVDERANPEQRLALQSFAKEQGGDLFQEVVRVAYEPMELSFENGDLHSMKATLTAGALARIQTRALTEGDHICKSNEEVWYRPLNKLEHAMPAVAVANSYRGSALGTTWSSPDKRSAFVGSFSVASQ